ncbi:uncharacterized protein [Antedon mediterranea]|uniref:uncharacterized protein n=1 Tax=Antedon mediterranea TaxID=105859 RepID=UPI003AF48C94
MRWFFLTHASDGGLQPEQVHEFLKKKKPELKKLNKTQKNLLFPSEGKADIEDFDMTLLNILICNLCVCNDDESKTVNDLRIFRNDQAHKKDYRIYSQHDFDREWSRLSGILDKFGVKQNVIDRYAIATDSDILQFLEDRKDLKELKESFKDMEKKLDQHCESTSFDLKELLQKQEETSQKLTDLNLVMMGKEERKEHTLPSDVQDGSVTSALPQSDIQGSQQELVTKQLDSDSPATVNEEFQTQKKKLMIEEQERKLEAESVVVITEVTKEYPSDSPGTVNEESHTQLEQEIKPKPETGELSLIE